MGTPAPAGDKFPADLVSSTATASGTNATITNYQWDYDGDGNFDETTAAPSASHAYAEPGTFQAKVRVTDSNGKTNDATQPVVIFSRTPTATFTATPGAVDKNVDVTLDAGTSVDHDGSIVSYEWDLGAGFLPPSADPVLHTSWASAGTKTVKVRVTDNDGHTSAETTRTVTVNNHAPTAALTSSSTSLPVGGGSVNLDATGSADTDGTVDGYAWDLDGNGTFETPGGTTPTVTTSVTRTGANTIRVRVTDNDGATGDASVVVNVASPPPPPPPASSTGGSTTTTTTTTAKPAASTTPAPIVAVKPPSV